jgi:hypothetical protein
MLMLMMMMMEWLLLKRARQEPDGASAAFLFARSPALQGVLICT